MKSILIPEALGFAVVAIAIWVNELFDLPHRFFNTEPAIMNYHEAAVESAFVLVLGMVVILVTWHLIRRLTLLEKFIPICGFCKKTRAPGSDPFKQESWLPVELYVASYTGALFSHGVCPECSKKHYGFSPGE